MLGGTHFVFVEGGGGEAGRGGGLGTKPETLRLSGPSLCPELSALCGV